jgi:HlyD family secretion protein
MAHTLGLQRNDLHKRLRDAQARTSLLKQRFENRARLEALGLLPKISDERLQAEHAYLENQDTIADLQAKLTQLDSAMKQLDGQAKQLALQNLETSTARKNALQELRGRIALLEVQLAEHSRIVSQHSGRMLELTVHAGQVLQVGQRLGSVAVEEPASKLVGLLYLPIKAGKKVAPGMTVQVAPDTVARERFGSILGTVTAVSAFPVTREGMARLLGNADLVAALANQGPTLEVTTELTRDAATVSGYRWSSSAGPALRLTAGTTMTGRVVVEQRTPITYLLPFLRDSSGLY